MRKIEQVTYEQVLKKWDKGESIKILGIDTGIANIGWGIIEVSPNKAKIDSAGMITTTSDQNLAERLYEIGYELGEVIQTKNPTLMAYEELFFNKRFPNMMKTNLAVGVMIQIGWKYGLQPKNFRPQDAKYFIAESHNASKDEVAAAVAIHLGLLPNKLSDYPDHITDALAHALCYLGFLNHEKVKYKGKLSE